MKYLVTTAICFLLAIGIMVLGPRWASAQGFERGCGPTKEIFKSLQGKFKEVPLGVGLNGDNELVTVFISEAGTFSIVVSNPSGVSCIRSSGNEWMGNKVTFGPAA